MNEAGEKTTRPWGVVCFRCGGPAEAGAIESTRRIAWTSASSGWIDAWLTVGGVAQNPIGRGVAGPYGLKGHRCPQCRIVWFSY